MEQIQHPNHYKLRKYECFDEMLALFGKEQLISFCRLSAYKYFYRAGNKPQNDKQTDIDKANFYIEYINKLISEDK